MKISQNWWKKFMDTRYMNQSRINTEKPKVDNKPLEAKDEEQILKATKNGVSPIRKQWSD